jgi:hypothetical protein
MFNARARRAERVMLRTRPVVETHSKMVRVQVFDYFRNHGKSTSTAHSGVRAVGMHRLTYAVLERQAPTP